LVLKLVEALLLVEQSLLVKVQLFLQAKLWELELAEREACLLERVVVAASSLFDFQTFH